MIREIRNGFKMITYLRSGKSTLIVGGICTISGMILLLLSGTVNLFSSLICSYVWVFLEQIFYQTNAYSMLSVSPYRKIFDIVMPNIVMVCGALFSMIMISVSAIIHGEIYQAPMTVLLAYILLFLIMFYVNIFPKSYWVGIIVIVGVSFLMMFGIMFDTGVNFITEGDNPVCRFLTGYNVIFAGGALIVFGIVINIFFRKRLYKYELNKVFLGKYAQSAD